MKSAHVVVGLGFGDEGKGTMTDSLVRTTGARLVVRFNGGPQAAHHVVCDDGQWHSFHQFGAGTFAGARTHLSRFMLVDPLLLQREARELLQRGLLHPWGRLTVDPRCLVTTPYQQAMNRLRELARGENRHGSCGMGIGETVEDELLGRPVMRMGLLPRWRDVRDVLEMIRREKLAAAKALGASGVYYDFLKNHEISYEFARRYAAIAADLVIRHDADVLDTVDGAVVFEGAQGALLDQDCGFTPYTTWSKTTAQNALALVTELDRSIPVEVTGVVRAYATRHGAGPLPTELASSDWLVDDHNAANDWQGSVRAGAFDMAMLRYALAINCDVVKQLAITHMDKVHDGWPVAERYEGSGGGDTLTERVTAAKPVYTELAAAGFVAFVEAHAGVPVRWTSWGPTASAKRQAVQAEAMSA